VKQRNKEGARCVDAEIQKVVSPAAAVVGAVVGVVAAVQNGTVGSGRTSELDIV
jgi:hypothetical protein